MNTELNTECKAWTDNHPDHWTCARVHPTGHTCDTALNLIKEQQDFEMKHANACSSIKGFGKVHDPAEETPLAVTLVMFGWALHERFGDRLPTEEELVTFALEETGE